MPLYEYRCETCNQTFEVMQKFSDQPLEVHAGCGGRVEKLISSSALQFKGTGWYVTDYARGGKDGGAGEKAGEKTAEKAGEKGEKGEKKDGKEAAKEASKESSKPAAAKSDSGEKK
ncbi:MAG: zinc ribbon domain-containing protein [Acidobacteria bacterium]|nr:zinc ribbon domain-containing protein [Acidobacteriota bacterium]